jgi:PAS domain-containing protein
MPPGLAFRVPGPVYYRLRISEEKVSFLEKEGADVTHRPGRLDTAAEMLLFDLTRRRHKPTRNAILLETGDALARTYLNGAAGEALRATVAEAERLGFTVELGLEVDDALAALPWEALRLPSANGVPGERSEGPAEGSRRLRKRFSPAADEHGGLAGDRGGQRRRRH